MSCSLSRLAVLLFLRLFLRFAVECKHSGLGRIRLQV